MKDPIVQLSQYINRHTWHQAWRLAAEITRREASVGRGAAFWFQVALLASLQKNEQLFDAASKRMQRCEDFEPRQLVDIQVDAGLACLRTGKKDQLASAAGYFDTAYKLYQTLDFNDHNYEARHWYCRGRLMLADQFNTEAIHCFKQALGIWMNNSERPWEPITQRDILASLRPESNEQWVINCCFHLLRTIMLVNDAFAPACARPCLALLLARDPSRTRRWFARLFYWFGPPAAKVYALLERI